ERGGGRIRRQVLDRLGQRGAAVRQRDLVGVRRRGLGAVIEIDAGGAAQGIHRLPGERPVHAQAGRAAGEGPEGDGQAVADALVAQPTAARPQCGRPPLVRVETVAEAVAGGEVQVALGVEAEVAAALPDAGGAAVGRGVVHLLQRQVGRVVADNPAVIRTVVAVRGIGDVNSPIYQLVGHAVAFLARVKFQGAALSADARAGYG